MLCACYLPSTTSYISTTASCFMSYTTCSFMPTSLCFLPYHVMQMPSISCTMASTPCFMCNTFCIMLASSCRMPTISCCDAYHLGTQQEGLGMKSEAVQSCLATCSRWSQVVIGIKQVQEYMKQVAGHEAQTTSCIVPANLCLMPNLLTICLPATVFQQCAASTTSAAFSWWLALLANLGVAHVGGEWHRERTVRRAKTKSF